MLAQFGKEKDLEELEEELKQRPHRLEENNWVS